MVGIYHQAPASGDSETPCRGCFLARIPSAPQGGRMRVALLDGKVTRLKLKSGQRSERLLRSRDTTVHRRNCGPRLLGRRALNQGLAPEEPGDVRCHLRLDSFVQA